MTIYIVEKNADFNEGRGPMIFHKVFPSFEAAYCYVQKQGGVFGSAQDPIGDHYPQWKQWSFNGYCIKEADMMPDDISLDEELVSKMTSDLGRVMEIINTNLKSGILKQETYDKRKKQVEVARELMDYILSRTSRENVK